MEERKLKILFGKSGNGYLNPRISLPISWIRDMGISTDDKEVNVSYDENSKEIIIKKAN